MLCFNIVLMLFDTQFGDLTKFNLILGFNEECALLATLAQYSSIFMPRFVLKFCSDFVFPSMI